ncbi:hypothetical protein ACOMHN_007258 [Nucella lapillus]
MATAAAREVPSEDQCPLCNEVFTQPKLLHCGHLLCRKCLISCLKSEAEASCPLCHNPVVKDSGKTIKEFADGLPTDLAVQTLIESQQVLSQDRQCQFCGTQLAKMMCITCGDFYCSGCAAGHKRLSSTRDHVVEDLSALTAEKLASSRPFACASHSGEMCRVYCPTHGASLCLLCATINHRQCADIMELNSKVKEECAELEQMAASLKAEEAILERAIHQLSQQLQDVERSATAAIAEINAGCDHLESVLKSCRQRLKNLCQAKLFCTKNKMNTKKAGLLQQLARVTTHGCVVRRCCRVTRSDVTGPMSVTLKARRTDLSSRTNKLVADAKVDAPKMPVVDFQQVSSLKRELLMLCDVSSQAKGHRFSFHRNHGERVVLTNNLKTAERRSECYRGIVMSQDAMEVDMLYEVRIDVVDSSFASTHVCFGVVTQAPSTVSLPHWSGRLQHTHLLGPGWIMVNGINTGVENSVGLALAEWRWGTGLD